ncbi:transglutaminase-like cysteine peptidase [Sulfurimonas sp.]|uniref:transglutaminase-like cysteine peptidase n=1 Tax=Sulfurimonas sp. TaxID=2022749 RepID=UPI0035621BB8
MKFIRLCILISILSATLFSAEKTYIDNELLERITKKYGKFAKNRFHFLQKTIDANKKLNELEQLKEINDFYNGVRYATDKNVYNEDDYWATPWEFLGKDKGDCEDYVISKYFALKHLGIDSKKLYLTYVKSTKFKEIHMVLTYFKTQKADPLVLDNNNHRIFKASQRKDLIPIYNFNPTLLKKGKKKKSHKKWDKLIYNMKMGKI